MTAAQFIEIQRIMFCMSLETFKNVILPNETDEDYILSKFKTFSTNPAAGICSMDQEHAERLWNYLCSKL